MEKYRILSNISETDESPAIKIKFTVNDITFLSKTVDVTYDFNNGLVYLGESGNHYFSESDIVNFCDNILNNQSSELIFDIDHSEWLDDIFDGFLYDTAHEYLTYILGYGKNRSMVTMNISECKDDIISDLKVLNENLKNATEQEKKRMIQLHNVSNENLELNDVEKNFN